MSMIDNSQSCWDLSFVCKNGVKTGILRPHTLGPRDELLQVHEAISLFFLRSSSSFLDRQVMCAPNRKVN